jgi:release factor glutamine methyltransferase
MKLCHYQVTPSHSVKIAQRSNVWMPTEFGLTMGELLLNGAGPKKNELVMDMGTGSGILSILCGGKGAKVISCDLNQHALNTTKESWLANNLPLSNLKLVLSDLFQQIPPQLKGQFDLIISNPPTFPETPINRTHRQSRNEWELAGRDGREMLDALLDQGHNWLKDGGRLLAICTSKQDWGKTVKILEAQWSSWRIIREKTIPLANHYYKYLPLWQKLNKITPGNPRIIWHKNGWYQKLYFFEASK